MNRFTRVTQAKWLGRFCLAVVTLLPFQLAAQDTYLIQGGTVHTVSGGVLDATDVLLSGGRIQQIGSGLTVPAGAMIIDAAGLHVYPGMFNAFSQIGLVEINSVAVTDDTSEQGDFNPHLLSYSAVHPASERIPVTRANGVTHAVTAPSASNGGVGGQASAIHLDGWTVEEMVIARSVGMVMSWPRLGAGGGRFGGFGGRFGGGGGGFAQAQERYDEALDQLRGWLDQARQYKTAMESDAGPQRRDLRLEAMAPVLDGSLPVLVIADATRDIRNAVEFMNEQGLRMVLVSGADAAEVADFLAENDVGLLLRATQINPSSPDDRYNSIRTGPVTLRDAGVQFAMTGWGSSGPNPPSRTLPYEAANAVKGGLTPEEALRAITLTPAEILGLDSDIGSVEVGKIGNLIVTDGDPLQIRTQMLHVFVAGQPSSLSNKHSELYERYRARPGPGGGEF